MILWVYPCEGPQVVLWFIVNIKLLISGASVLVALSLSKDFSCPEIPTCVSEASPPWQKYKSGGSIERCSSWDFFGQVLDVDVHLHFFFFFSFPCVCISRIFCRARFGTLATVFPHPFVLCCWSWVGLCEGQYGPVGRGGWWWFVLAGTQAWSMASLFL